MLEHSPLSPSEYCRGDSPLPEAHRRSDLVLLPSLPRCSPPLGWPVLLAQHMPLLLQASWSGVSPLKDVTCGRLRGPWLPFQVQWTRVPAPRRAQLVPVGIQLPSAVCPPAVRPSRQWSSLFKLKAQGSERGTSLPRSEAGGRQHGARQGWWPGPLHREGLVLPSNTGSP